MCGIANLPAEFVPLVSAALSYYRDGVVCDFDCEMGKRFADFMTREIQK